MLTLASGNATVAYWIAEGEDNSTLHFRANGSDLDCWSATTSVLLHLVDSQTERPPGNVGAGHLSTDEYEGYQVTRNTVVNRDGEVVSSANISESRLQAIVPELVNGTVTNNVQSMTCTAPIRVNTQTTHQA